MFNLKAVRAFVTSDGALFNSLTEAQDHQRDLNLRACLTKIIDDIYFHNISELDLVNGLMLNKDKLLEVLTKHIHVSED